MLIKSINGNKAVGCDNIPPRYVKTAAPIIAPIITGLINKGISNSEFPDSLKQAEVAPIYKKADRLQKQNYRPVSILPTLSKIFEKVLASQITNFFKDTFSPHLSAFRSGYSCQHALLDIMEKWKLELRQGKIIGSLLMDLSKAFDCISHKLLIAKLEAYGLGLKSIKLMQSYLNFRKQRVKIGNIMSTYKLIEKGVPQGSILGPILFNIFINDLFYFIKTATLTNYADDNTLSYGHKSENLIRKILIEETNICLNWFKINCMAANPGKFQVMFLGKAGISLDLEINGFSITPEKSVKLLGITIDSKLNFSEHVTELCKKTSKQLNVLRRLSYCMNTDSKLTLFRSYMLSHFSYCSIIWHFCGKVISDKIEKIQEKALRTVYTDYSTPYDKLLERANLPTLKGGRLQNFAIVTYKIQNKLCPIFLENLITLKLNKYKLRSGNFSLELPSMSSTNYGLHSFTFLAPKLWNAIPENVRLSKNLAIFKN
jgi:hypothetical protein